MNRTLAFRAHPALTRAAMLAAAEEHRAADRYITGTYWNDGRGCAVGCAVETVRQRAELDLYHGDHAGLADALGWPVWLARVEDTIFEGLPPGARSLWPVNLIAAIPDGADLSGVRDEWLGLILRRIVLPVAGAAAGVVERVARGLETGWCDDERGGAYIAAARAADATIAAAYAARAALLAAAPAAAAYAACASYTANDAYVTMSGLLLDCLRRAPTPLSRA